MPFYLSRSFINDINQVKTVVADCKNCKLIIKYKNKSEDIISYKDDESLLYFDFNFVKYKIERNIKGENLDGR